MASHNYNDDYYYGSSQSRPLDTSPSPVSQFDPRYAPSQQPTPAPSYHTNLPPPPRSAQAPYPTSQQDPPARTGPSPFDTVFDDHVYPVNSHTPAAAASMSDMSQQGHYGHQDTGYYGREQPGQTYGHGAYGQPLGSSDDIPLQDRPSKTGPDLETANDHIYDDPNAPPGSKRRKRRKVGLGQLGMLGSDKKSIPWVVYIFTVCQIGVFIGQIINNAILTGSPIMINPQFNYMIGPSTQVMINMGARYVPCMKNIDELQGATIEVGLLCPNATRNDEYCPLSDLCGFGGVPNPVFDGDVSQDPRPNQWYRFILPLFLHAGLIHIAFNMLLQLTLAREMEQVIGSIRFFLVYVSAGIFGFVMGANFSAPFLPVVGASGSLFGILALNLLDLLYSWKDRKSPVKDLIFILIDMIISFVLGLLPGLDNFSHIGGFLIGLALGVSVLHSPNSLRLKIGQDVAYSTVDGTDTGVQPFTKNPLGFFKGRKPLWWAWWLVRAGALVLVIVVFIVLINNFYTTTDVSCSWCKYLSCLPVNGWCELGTVQTSTT